jgi:hypothetical protein
MAQTVDTRRKMKMVVKIKNMVYLIKVSTALTRLHRTHFFRMEFAISDLLLNPCQ